MRITPIVFALAVLVFAVFCAALSRVLFSHGSSAAFDLAVSLALVAVCAIAWAGTIIYAAARRPGDADNTPEQQ